MNQENNLQEHKILVKNTEDPISIAMKHIRCPKCDNPLNKNWECVSCGIYLIFVQPETKFNFKRV